MKNAVVQSLLSAFHLLFEFCLVAVTNLFFQVGEAVVCGGFVALCIGKQLVDHFSVAGELLGVGELLEDGAALVATAAQEIGKLPLRQHRHAVELLEREPDGIFDLFGDVAVLDRKSVV